MQRKMQRKIGLIGAAAGFLLAMAPLDAQALAQVFLVWPASDSTEIVAAPGENIDLAILIQAGEEGISSYGISISFDSDLDFIAANELLPAGFSFNLSPGVDGGEESEIGDDGVVFTFEAATFGAGAVDTVFLAGVISFRVVDPRTDAADVFAGLFNAGIDGMFDSNGNPAEVVFGSASVVPVPEPGTLLLLGAGLAGIAGARRERRR